MEESELKKQLSKIKKQLVKRKIIARAMRVAKKYGVNKTVVHTWYTRVIDTFSGIDYRGKLLSIEHVDGWTMFGGEDVSLSYEGKRVFYADSRDTQFRGSQYNPADLSFPIKIGELYVHEYLPGKWEQQLALIYRKGPKPEKKSKDRVVEPEIDQSKLEELASRLPIKI